MEINQLHPLFAAEIVGLDAASPPDAKVVRVVEDAMARYGVVALRDCDITDEQHVRFSRAFGPLELPARWSAPRKGAAEPPPKRRPIAPELFDASNLDENNEIIPYDSEKRKLAKGAEKFHTDSSFNPLPTKWSLLRGAIVPPAEIGGSTHFVDCRAAYDDLPQAMKDRLEGMVAIHDFVRGRERAGTANVDQTLRDIWPPVRHRLVRTMPYGRKCLFLGGHAVEIEGMEEEEGWALLQELYEHATREKYIYRHQWKPGDIVIWDNRCTMHRATAFESNDYKRDMRRTTINESGEEMSSLEARQLANA